MTLEEVQKDLELQANQVQLASNEVEKLKQQLASEKKNASDTSMELQALKLELEKSKNEAEHLRLMERHFEERRYLRSNSRLELEDAKNTIAELKEELSYKSSVNRSLGLQLEKTIESNSELLLEIKDLDDLLQSKEKDIEELKSEVEKRQGPQRTDAEKGIGSLERRGSEPNGSDLARKTMYLEMINGSRASDDIIEDFRAHNEILQTQLEKAETEIYNTGKENMNLSSKLMDLRHENEEKSSLMQELEQRLALLQAQASLDVEALEAKAGDLLANVDDLREKLRVSEELSRRQLDSKEVLMEDLIGTVEALRVRNEQLELSLESSEDRQAGLAEELEALQRELLAHEKERSLLASQRGQLKALRERIATLTESNEISLERGDKLELAMKTMKEEHLQTLAKYDEQVKLLEIKLHDANAECTALREGLQKAEAQAEARIAETSLLSVAKEVAEAKASSLDAAYTALQEQYHILVAGNKTADDSLCSLQATYAALQEQLKVAEQGSSKTIHELQERDSKISMLTEALSSAESRLKGACEKISDRDDTVSALQEELEHMQDQERLHDGHIENLQCELAGTKESMNNSRISLSASEDRIRTLEIRNGDLSEMLQSAVSFKEDVVSRLERTLERQQELESKLRERELAFENLKHEKASSDHTIEELQERICTLKDERVGSLKGKDEDKDVRELHKILRTQVEVLKQSMRESRMEKERAENSVQKLQTANTNLVHELKKWKDKVKACHEELALWKEKARTSRRLSAASEEKPSLSTDVNAQCAKKSTDLSPKGELLKVRKQAADLRRKLLEQEEEKEDLKRRLLSYQKELHRKEDLMNVAEKRLKEKGKESRGGLRQPTRQTTSTSRRFGVLHSNGGKVPVDFTERVKSLEAELNIKTVELEATQFLLKEKEGGSDGHLHADNDKTGEWHANAIRPEDTQIQNKILFDVSSHEIFEDEIQRLLLENQNLKELLLHKKEETGLDDESPSEGSNQGVLQRERENEDLQCTENTMSATDLQEELRDIKDRYSQMSLQFAELQVEKEELLITMRNMSKDGCSR